VAQTDVFPPPGLPPANVEPYYEAARLASCPPLDVQTPVSASGLMIFLEQRLAGGSSVDGTMLAEDALQENAAAFQQAG